MNRILFDSIVGMHSVHVIGIVMRARFILFVYSMQLHRDPYSEVREEIVQLYYLRCFSMFNDTPAQLQTRARTRKRTHKHFQCFSLRLIV